MRKEELELILINHKKWFLNKEGGERAYLQGADLQGADLRGADLQGADLRGADLQGAYLRGAYGNNKEIKDINCLGFYKVVYTKEFVWIGCKKYTLSEWENFTDLQIKEIAPDSESIEWFNKNKSIIIELIKSNPAG